MKKLLVVVMLTSMVLFSVGCEKNNVDTEQNTTVEDSGNKDTSETIDSEKNNQKQEEETWNRNSLSASIAAISSPWSTTPAYPLCAAAKR